MELPLVRFCVLVALIACLLLEGAGGEGGEKRRRRTHHKCKNKGHKHKQAALPPPPPPPLDVRPSYSSVEALARLDYNGRLTVCGPNQLLRCSNCANATLAALCLNVTCANKPTWSLSDCAPLEALTCSFNMTCDCDNPRGYFRKSDADHTCIKCQ